MMKSQKNSVFLTPFPVKKFRAKILRNAITLSAVTDSGQPSGSVYHQFPSWGTKNYEIVAVKDKSVNDRIFIIKSEQGINIQFYYEFIQLMDNSPTQLSLFKD